jgi:hypothetical protein
MTSTTANVILWVVAKAFDLTCFLSAQNYVRSFIPLARRRLSLERGDGLSGMACLSSFGTMANCSHGPFHSKSQSRERFAQLASLDWLEHPNQPLDLVSLELLQIVHFFHT